MSYREQLREVRECDRRYLEALQDRTFSAWRRYAEQRRYTARLLRMNVNAATRRRQR